MKVSENTAETPSTLLAPAWPSPSKPIAPWWHTAIVILVIAIVSVLSTLQARAAGFSGSHVRNYLTTLIWEWLLALLAWWGIRMRRTPLREILGERRSGLRAWARDLGAAMIFWFMAMIVLAAIASVLRLLHLIHAQKAVVALVPQTFPEVLLWFALSITAGMVEEFVFRGYLLQQFASIRKNVWIGVIVSSLFFGAAHGYEGLGAMIAITAYGAMFCLLAMERRSLRAGMMAHAWHDSFTGIAAAILKHLHRI